MYKLIAIFLIAFVASESMAMHHRLRRQAVASSTPAPAPTQPVSGQNNVNTQDCIRSCPVTSEYNPVCGSNGVTYSNPGRLLCAQACGESVNVRRTAPCPTT